MGISRAAVIAGLLGVIAILSSRLFEPGLGRDLSFDIGIGMIGYALIAAVIELPAYLRSRRASRGLRRALTVTVAVRDGGKQIPQFVALDVEGCITPRDRAPVDLTHFARLRAYCDWRRDGHENYPPLVIFTGRSQGYVELLSQTFNLIDGEQGQVPFVIENGSALYTPGVKKTESLIRPSEQEMLDRTESRLRARFPANEFEPKAYMITINPRSGQPRETAASLKTEVRDFLRELDDIDETKLDITNSATAVDITLSARTKLAGIKEVVQRRGWDLRSGVALGDNESDLAVLESVGGAYCPADADQVVRDRVPVGNRSASTDIEFVLEVIERTCGLSIAAASPRRSRR